MQNQDSFSVALKAYISISLQMFASAYAEARKFGLSEKISVEYAKCLLNHFMSSQQTTKDENDFSLLMKKMTPGGSA